MFILAKNSKILGQKCCLDHSSVDGNGNRKFLCGKIPFVWTRKGRKEPLDWRLVMFFRQFLHQFFPRTFRTQTLRHRLENRCLVPRFHIMKNQFWAVVWAGLWNKRAWADYEQLLKPVFSLFRGQIFFFLIFLKTP